MPDITFHRNDCCTKKELMQIIEKIDADRNQREQKLKKPDTFTNDRPLTRKRDKF